MRLARFKPYVRQQEQPPAPRTVLVSETVHKSSGKVSNRHYKVPGGGSLPSAQDIQRPPAMEEDRLGDDMQMEEPRMPGAWIEDEVDKEEVKETRLLTVLTKSAGGTIGASRSVSDLDQQVFG